MLRAIITVACGIVLGYVIGEVSRIISPTLYRLMTEGAALTLRPVTLGLTGFSVTFGFHLMINLANILGILLAFALARKVH